MSPKDADRMANSKDFEQPDQGLFVRSGLTRIFTVCTDKYVHKRRIIMVVTGSSIKS